MGKTGPDLMKMLDLVALATVADVAPLTGVNRAFVRQGLKIMAQRGRPGLVSLCDLGRLDTAPNSYHLGFVLGPRVNAGGRIGKADLGARLLSTNSPAEAHAIAERLDQLNSERREIEASVRRNTGTSDRRGEKQGSLNKQRFVGPLAKHAKQRSRDEAGRENTENQRIERLAQAKTRTRTKQNIDCQPSADRVHGQAGQ